MTYVNRRSVSRARLRLRDAAQRLAIAAARSKPYPPIATIVRAYGDGEGHDVLVFGDSVAGRTARYDVVRTTLLAHIADGLAPDRSTCGVAHPGFHPGVYLALARTLAVLRGSPETVVVPVNIRCFSPQWALNPKWQFDHVIAASERFRSDPAHVPTGKIDALPSKAAIEEFMSAPANVVGYEGWSVGDFERRIRRTSQIPLSELERRRLTFAYHYLSPIEPTNPRVRALRDLVMTTRTLGCALLVYFTPINHEAGRRLHGDLFAQMLAANVDAVRTATTPIDASSDPQVSVEDWTQLFSSAAFLHPLLPTEHLNASGREQLAAEIVRSSSALAGGRT